MKAEKQNFEIEHWPNYFGKHALLRLAKGYVKVWMVFGTAAVVTFILFYFTHISILGTAAQVCLLGLLISPLLPIISYIQRDRKNPSYGINEKGFLLNERGWNSAFFTWDEIDWIKPFTHPKYGQELHFEFEDVAKALNKPNQKFQQSLTREYVLEKQPKKISGQLVKGDVGPFIEKFTQYFKAHKQKQGMSKDKAFAIARDFLTQYSIPLRIAAADGHREEKLLDLEGAVWIFPDKDAGRSIVVSEVEKAVYCVLKRNNEKHFPQHFENPLSKKEAIQIAKAYIEANRLDVKIQPLKVFFYQEGLESIDDPVWLVSTKMPENSFDGQNEMDLLISVISKKVEDRLIS